MFHKQTSEVEKLLKVHVVEALFWKICTADLCSITERGLKHRFFPKDFPILTGNLFNEAAANGCFRTAIRLFPFSL